MAGWVVVVVALVYLCGLFAVAHLGDTFGRRLIGGGARASIYAVALAVYCTSWTFFGSVGLAGTSGLDFLTVYIGPILLLGIGFRFVIRIAEVAKAQNITSIADFLAARYGKNDRVAVLVTVIAAIGVIPYIALQLKAVSSSLTVFFEAAPETMLLSPASLGVDLAFVVAGVLAIFAVAFGTRHVDATEHQDGLVLAIALESLVKLIAFLVVGIFVTYIMFDGVSDILERAAAAYPASDMQQRTSGTVTFLTLTLLSLGMAMLLPRQFHMMIVENREISDVRRAAWMFPLYLVAINLFVLPLALAGQAAFSPGEIDPDMTVLALPLAAGAYPVALIAFVGGLSAATAMVIVDSVALAIMISNDLIIPFILRRRARMNTHNTGDLSGFVLLVRRGSIVCVILLAYVYYRVSGDAALASIGFLSFAAIAQLGPAFVGGFLWRRGTALGASAGLIAGFATWAYTLLLPSLASGDEAWTSLVEQGPFAVEALRPTALFGTHLPELTHGVLWSLAINLAAYIVFSLLRPETALERLQANAFIGADGTPPGGSQIFWLRSSPVSVEDLRAAVARYLGEERTARAFDSFTAQRGGPTSGDADIHQLRYAEHLLASAIGASSSRLVLSLLLRGRNLSTHEALRLLDDASATIQYNRDILQHGLDHARQGITILDRDLRLIGWNRAFRDLYDLPADLVRFGIGIDEILRYNAGRGSYGSGATDDLVTARLSSLVSDLEPVRLKLMPTNRVIEVRSNHLPDGGLVTTYTDITDTVAAEEALEQRVRERTEELTQLNVALTRAKAEADEANASKTRFLAAASHDILQPLNAARLYATSLIERDRKAGDPLLAENVEASLDAVEEILTALLDISRLDSGAMQTEISSLRIDDLLKQLQREFDPAAREKGIRLKVVAPALTVRSDRRLLRRMLQNLVSNAIKYTAEGKVLVGARQRGDTVSIEVWDTGQGIPHAQQHLVFREFHRLQQGAKVARGLGLGLSIVERSSRVLGHPVTLRSEPGRGTVFTVTVPLASPVAPEPPALSAPVPLIGLDGLRILAIDNEPAIIAGMQQLLGGWGCTVMVADGAASALDMLNQAEARPDVIIADYHLDEGDGLGAIAMLRERLGHDRPAILLTADRSPAVRQQAEAVGVHVLNKPLKPAALRALLTRWRATG
ncbi:hybrid sensor histidine kinase/response regulator [Pseudochelatococcus contaminans]|uniref:histidine kinase n=1 Tax=Pseudochelatococcus contaminans TaxID=1538103 RepID=A0A7W5Z1U8_9HYPH|nr:hybrid sensor histidine kinase/response regulator [Pseudochelatococcus contaminans]MBB3808496.1 Na+/proline symporter/CheY-like chemotaxis protein [Pseudochelatococcus contaminans]